jgi:hypothetical protein
LAGADGVEGKTDRGCLITRISSIAGIKHLLVNAIKEKTATIITMDAAIPLRFKK